MSQEILIERLFQTLVNGDRDAARSVVAEIVRDDAPPERMITDLFWPTYERIEKLYRNDQLTTLAHHFATRLLRVLVDQTALRLHQPEAGPERSEGPGAVRSIFAVCGPTDADELAAQMAVDLLEGHGHTVRFAGGGIAMDEILAYVQQESPDALLLFASAPTDLPEIRGLIDSLDEIDACSPKSGRLQVVVGGGVFNRAEGLAEEIGADLWADSPADLTEQIAKQPERRATPEQRTVGRNKRKRSAA